MPKGYQPKLVIRPGWYVYQHSRPDGSIFYVGAGHEGRAWNFARWAGRNATYNRIVHEIRALGLQPEVKIVMQGLTRANALRHEGAITLNLQQHGVDLAVADKTEWYARRGAKLKGRVFSAETRQRMRLAKLGTKQSPEHIANRGVFRKQSAEHIAKRVATTKARWRLHGRRKAS
jgi:hypothetical protein